MLVLTPSPNPDAIRKALQDEILNLAEAHFLGARSDIFWLTKLEFFHRHKLESSIKNPGVPFWGRFLRQKFGPVCPQVYDSTGRLIECSLLEEDEKGQSRRITGAGERIFAALRSHIDKATLATVSEIAAELKKLTFNQIKNKCYELSVPWNGKTAKIKDLPMNAVIYNYPSGQWKQVVPDDVISAFKASLEAHKPDELVDRAEDIEELVRAFG